MKESTQKTISGLYLLRSSLSIVSLKYDHINKLRNDINTQKQKSLPIPQPSLSQRNSDFIQGATILLNLEKAKLESKKKELEKKSKFLLFFQIRQCKKLKEEIAHIENEILVQEKRIKHAEETRAQAIADYEQKLSAYELELKDFERTKVDTIEKLNARISIVKDEFDSLYSYTKAAATNLLDERDWQHLDIVIYMLETGRADTIKEALQQADLFVRHNEIKEMVATAATVICATIQDNFCELSNTVNTRLSEIKGTLSGINQHQKSIAVGMERLIGTQELNNALLQKANVSSERMAKDLSELRTYCKN